MLSGKPSMPKKPDAPKEPQRENSVDESFTVYNGQSVEDIKSNIFRRIQNGRGITVTDRFPSDSEIKLSLEYDYDDTYVVVTYPVVTRMNDDQWERELKKHEKAQTRYELKLAEWAKKQEEYDIALADWEKRNNEKQEEAELELYKKLKKKYN